MNTQLPVEPEEQRFGTLFTFIGLMTVIVPAETAFVSSLVSGDVAQGGIPWADAWLLPILAGFFLLAAAPGLAIITAHPTSNDKGALVLRWVIIGIAALCWVFIDSPKHGWSTLLALAPFLWISFAYKQFTKPKTSEQLRKERYYNPHS